MHAPVSKVIVSLSSKEEAFFRKTLMKWYDSHTRSFPWVGIKNPYRVWLSEIILQQTRVEQGLPYYEKILDHFPTICDMAHADEQLVFRLWQGLGYYNRCKNMLAAARLICEQYGGVFPKTYEEILALPGVGPYTAAAISSFAYDLPHAVVDGNVERLLSRFWGIDVAVNTTQGKKIFREIASRLLDADHAAQYNQAIMDFGATVCLPGRPLCTTCPFSKHCVAFEKKLTDKLPVKKPKNPVKNRFLHYAVFRHKNTFYIRKRPAEGIWQNLHEFLLIESDREQPEKELVATKAWKEVVKGNEIILQSYSPLYIHQLTHRRLRIRFLQVVLKDAPNLPDSFFPVDVHQLDAFAFPRPLVKYITTLEAV